MDLFIEPSKGMPFCIEVGYFDSMKEIKEKVAKYHGIPVYEQTLIFKDRTLPDDLNIHNSDIFDRSRIQLQINNNNNNDGGAEKVVVKTEEGEEEVSCKKIKIVVKNSGLRRMMEVELNDSVSKLKEKINEMELGGGGYRMYANGIEIDDGDDDKTLGECQVVDGSEVEIITTPLKPSTTTSTSIGNGSSSSMMMMMSMGSNSNNNKKLKVNVMSKSGKKIGLEMNPSSNVGELRKELAKVIRNGNGGFRLPEEAYFFIYKQNVMEEDQSFRWHRVAHGDTIEIFNGCVTGGGS